MYKFVCGFTIFSSLGYIPRSGIAGSSNNFNMREEPALKLYWTVFLKFLNFIWVLYLRASSENIASIIPVSHSCAGYWELYLIDYSSIIICDLEANIVRVYTTEFTEFLPCACTLLTLWRCQKAQDIALSLKVIIHLKQPKCPSILNQLSKLWYSHMLKYSIAA